ncbi:transporter [Gammaproteobacteria bacterium]|nr:transporter [Gammaproteobacteria bacterium]
MFLRFMIFIIASSYTYQNTYSQGVHRADDHAPISVMGDHYHSAGEVMFSYRYMSMTMEGSQIGSSKISSDLIATTIPNRFSSMDGQPPTLRIVPTKMTMNMHMLGAMYAPADWITLMAMVNYLDNEMHHSTYKGMMGTTVRGSFTTKTSGLGDTKFSALIRARETESDRLHITAGISIPTGDLDQTATILNPMGMKPTIRAPYGMQLSSGTNDFIGGLTYSQFHDGWSWGTQWQSTIRTGTNDENYTLGDEHRITGWYSRPFPFTSNFSWSTRAEYFNRGNIQGMDSKIMGPVQTADPDNYGANRISIGLGINFATGSGHRVALEYVMPIQQDLKGPQLKAENQMTLGYQFTF